MLDSGADVNAVDMYEDSGQTPILRAAEVRFHYLMKPLYISDFLLNQSNLFNFSFLKIQHGHKDVVKFLLDRGADPGLAEAEGWTPICYAVAVHLLLNFDLIQGCLTKVFFFFLLLLFFSSFFL